MLDMVAKKCRTKHVACVYSFVEEGGKSMNVRPVSSARTKAIVTVDAWKSL